MDADPLAEAADFTAVIDWGDNTTSSGTISDNAVAGFDVSGTHVYATGGKYRIVVDITDSGGSTTISRNTATVYAPPQSSVGALPTHEPATFAVKWSGAPGIGASSISSYDVFVSDSGGLFAPFMHATTATSAMFTGVNGHSYGFYSVATDDRGNVEPTPSNAQAVTRVDAAAPTSKVAALPAISGQSFTVAWSGGDDNGGSGIASYDVFVSDNGGSFTPWQTATTASSAAFMGMTGHTYSFYSVATDKVGNHQPTPNGAQAATTVPAPIVLPSSSVAALPPLSPTTFTVSWSGSDAGGPGIATYDVFVSDNGGSFTAFETATTAASATFTGVSGHSYGFYSVATDKVGNRQPPPTVAQASTQIVTAPAPPVAVGDTWVLGPGNASSGFDTTGVLKNDVSVDGHPENVVSTLTTGVSHGQLTLNSDGSFSYAADSTFKGIDRFAYQDSEGGTHGNIVGVTLLSYNASLVDKLYHQVLHRSAEDQGLIYWATQLDAGAHLDAVATDIFNSSERLNPLVTQFYEQYLLRGTDPDGLAYWVHAWQSKGDPRDVVESILASPEFFDDAGDTSVGFVALLYQRVLQRNAEQTGLGYWVSLMSNPPTDPPQTRFQIASQFYDTHEKHVGLVDFLFGEYFNGVSPLPSIEPYVADLDFPSNQTETQVEKAIIDSPEYSNAPPEPSAGAVGRAMYDH